MADRGAASVQRGFALHKRVNCPCGNSWVVKKAVVGHQLCSKCKGVVKVSHG